MWLRRENSKHASRWSDCRYFFMVSLAIQLFAWMFASWLCVYHYEWWIGKFIEVAEIEGLWRALDHGMWSIFAIIKRKDCKKKRVMQNPWRERLLGWMGLKNNEFSAIINTNCPLARWKILPHTNPINCLTPLGKKIEGRTRDINRQSISVVFLSIFFLYFTVSLY